jgi:2-oxoisovalerate dehydrogenase E2 component (dihydrolipoyl transacylase)
MGLAQIKMPQLGESVTEGTVDKWLKREGDFVKRDEPLVEVVTDKVNAEIPSPFEGKLVKISVTEGETVRVGSVIAQIEVAGVPAAAASPSATPAGPTGVAQTEVAGVPAAAASPSATPAGPTGVAQIEVAGVPAAAASPSATPARPTGVAQTEVPPEPEGGPAPEAAPVAAPGEDGEAERPRLSPAVRKLASEHGIDAAALRGSGMGGRVTRDDVLAAVGGSQTASAPPATKAAPPSAAPSRPAPAPIDGKREELVKLSVMRRSIAEHMVRSLATSPHAWTLQEVDVTNLVRYRDAEKESFKARHGAALTYMPFVVQIVCEVIKQYPWLNSTWTDDGVVLKRYINMGIAVSIPDGLIVPVLKDADQRGFTDLVSALNDLIERARNKHLKPEDVQGGTFTLNNTGSTGSVASQPIINQPQAAILTTESIVKRPVVINDAIAVRQIMNMCLSFDHRIIDGMMAGQFLGEIKKRLEDWTPGSIRL